VVSRILQTVVDDLRHMGHKIGMIRPISLWPFPSQYLYEVATQVRGLLVVELSNGQMVDDVKLAVKGRTAVHFFNRMGGMVPSTEEIAAHVLPLLTR
jgi:pyruvate/2-oxoacid:ferredoxin oxidoreductase alpha subunit